MTVMIQNDEMKIENILTNRFKKSIIKNLPNFWAGEMIDKTMTKWWVNEGCLVFPKRETFYEQ